MSHMAPEFPFDAYLDCVTCREYWRERASIVVPRIERAAAITRSDADVMLHRFRLGVHARHLRGSAVLPDTCCAKHIPGTYGACCDPDNCVPCCRDCPTCPTRIRQPRKAGR